MTRRRTRCRSGHRIRRRAYLVAAILALTLLSGACGIPASSAPQALSRGNVPFGLLSPSATSPRANPSRPQAATVVYLLQAGHLVPTVRSVDAPLSLQKVLGALVQGPTDSETTSGLQSAISTQAQLTATGVSGGVATIDLGRAFGQIGGREQILAVAQVIFTVTNLPSVTGVTFTDAGQPVDAPAGDGTLTSGPLVRQDFATLAPP